MSSILLISLTGPAFDFLSLLSRDLGTAANAEEALCRVDLIDTVIVDTRSDLAWARTAIALIRQTRPNMPLLFMVAGSALGLLNFDWGFSDFVIDDREIAGADVRLRLLLHSGNRPCILVAGLIRIDEDAYHAIISSGPPDLVYTEFELPRYLIQHQDKVLTREMLLSKVWGHDYFDGTRTVDVHIRRLRAKLG